MIIRNIVFLGFFFLLTGTQVFAVQEHKATRNFWHPEYLGERLAYCALGDKDCGKKVADSYCKMMGYDNAKQYIIAHNVGLTHYISSRAVCKGWTCDGFKTIACSQNLSRQHPAGYHYRKRHFVYPRYNDYRVDWCYDKKSGCGYKAAHAFCRRLGYIKPIRYQRQSAIHATKTMGSQELCFGSDCDGFKYIDCSR